jgi:hypothetical protein
VSLGRAHGAERGHGQRGCGRSGAEEFGREVEERKGKGWALTRGVTLSEEESYARGLLRVLGSGARCGP